MDGNLNIYSALEESLLELERLGMSRDLRTEQVKVYTGIGTRFAGSAKKGSVALHQGSKLTLANSQNASVFDNLRARKTSTSKRL